MAHPTLTARWSNVAIATWVLPAASISKFIPKSKPPGPDGRPAEGIEPDVHPGTELSLGDGRAGVAVSLVARRATHVRILGLGIPRMGGFDSVSLTIAVRERASGRRGVVCVREIVGHRTFAWLLRRWYNHPCVAAPIASEVKQQTQLIGAEYRLAFPRAGLAPGSYVSKRMETDEQMLRVVGKKPAIRAGAGANGTDNSEPSAYDDPQPGPRNREESVEAWLSERPFVFGLDARAHPIAHEVIHPSWSIYPAVDFTVDVDFASLFGPDLGFLSGMPPRHVMLAAGSEVSMFPSHAGGAGVRWGERRG